MMMNDNYVKAKENVLNGMDVDVACNKTGMSKSSYYRYRRLEKKTLCESENAISLKLLLLYMMLIAESMMLIAFWLKIL